MELFWIWLAVRSHVSDREKATLLKRFSNPEDIYYAHRSELEQVIGLRKEACESLFDKDLTQAEQILKTCRQNGIQLLTMEDSRYPARLRAIDDPPVLLYYKGQLPDFEAVPAIGVVGTRRASLYGRNIAYRMGVQISRCGGLVVSGMASGIDGEATLGALTAGKPAVGILGCGVDVVYPKENRMLFRQMEEEGCLISEFAPGTPGYKWNFPKRNRIISGLSCGVLVVEAPVQSGALITAQQALEQGRDVFVVPGNIDVASCEGSNELLRSGAIMASSGWDVIREYAHLYPDTVVKDLTPVSRERRGMQVAQTVKKITALPSDDKKDIDNRTQPPYIDRERTASTVTAQEQTVLNGLSGGEGNIDDVVAETGLSTGVVMAALTMLQIKGYVTMLPGGRVVKHELEEIHGKCTEFGNR